jgi:hypothetical protein
MLYTCLSIAFHAMQNKPKWLKIESLNVVLRNQWILKEMARKYEELCILDKEEIISANTGHSSYRFHVGDDSRIKSNEMLCRGGMSESLLGMLWSKRI